MRAVDAYRDTRDLAAACKTLSALAEQHPTAAAIRTYLAGYLYLANRFEDALPHALRAVALAPNKAMPARQLFHTHFALGNLEAAESEARRYRSLAQNPEAVAEWDSLIGSVSAAREEHVDDA